jgi:hypothetical protein
MKLKTRKSQSSTGGLWQPGYVALPESREVLTRVPKRPRSEGSTLVYELNPLQRPRDPMRPGTYREALIWPRRPPHIQSNPNIPTAGAICMIFDM